MISELQGMKIECCMVEELLIVPDSYHPKNVNTLQIFTKKIEKVSPEVGEIISSTPKHTWFLFN